MASLKKLLTDSVVYGLSSIVGRFLNYLLVPLYTYKIAAASGGYGVVTNIYAYTALLLVLLTFGMETTFFYFANKREADRRSVFSTALTAVSTVALVFAVVVLAFLKPISEAVGYSDHPEYIGVMAVVVALDACQSILFAKLRLEGKAWKFAGLKLMFIILNIGLNLFVFLVAPNIAEKSWMGWYDGGDLVGYVFKVNLICTGLVTFGFWRELSDYSLRSFSPAMLKEMLSYAWPLLLLGIAGILNQVADKILMPYLLPGEEGRVQLGMYGACVKIAMLMAIITQAFRYAYEPFVFGGSHDADSKSTQASAMKFFVMFTMLAFLAVMSYMDIFKYLVSNDYWEALDAVPVVMMAEIAMGIYFNLSFWYKLNGETWWGAVMSMVGCVVLVGINVVFVPRYGYMACAWGGLAGYTVCMLMSYLIGRKRNPVPYRVTAILGYIMLGLLLYGIEQMLCPDQLWLRLVLNTCAVVIYLGVVVYDERNTLRPIAQRILHK